MVLGTKYCDNGCIKFEDNENMSIYGSRTPQPKFFNCAKFLSGMTGACLKANH